MTDALTRVTGKTADAKTRLAKESDVYQTYEEWFRVEFDASLVPVRVVRSTASNDSESYIVSFTIDVDGEDIRGEVALTMQNESVVDSRASLGYYDGDELTGGTSLTVEDDEVVEDDFAI